VAEKFFKKIFQKALKTSYEEQDGKIKSGAGMARAGVRRTTLEKRALKAAC